MEEISPEMVLKWDKTGLNIVPPSSWTMERRGKACEEMVGANDDKRQITALLLWHTGQGFLTTAAGVHGEVFTISLSLLFPQTFSKSLVHRGNNVAIC